MREQSDQQASDWTPMAIEDIRRIMENVETDVFVAGQWRAAAAGDRFPVEDPSSGEPLCEVAEAGVADGEAALAAAVDARGWWREMPSRKRSDLLHRAYELLIERIEDFATLITAEMGKPLAEARGEVRYAAEFFRWFGQEAVRIEGEYTRSPDGGSRFLITREPVGPCLLVTPWNFPLAMGARKIAPALAAGCTVIAKPAEQTPLSMLALAKVLDQAGVPDGVLNVIPTSDPAPLVSRLLGDARVRKLSFTGSTVVGKQLLRQAADQVQRVSLELGGNAPFVVFEDADLDAAVAGAMVAKMRNIGEACTAANRFFVQDSVLEEFGKRLADRMGSLRVGNGLEEGVEVGPLIDAAAVQKVRGLVADAVDRGARILLEGGPFRSAGHFYAPQVLTDVPAEAEITAEEIFGPVAALTRFGAEEEVIAAANDTDYGLSSYVYTRDLSRALRVSEGIEAGMVGVNTGRVSDPAAPFGGVKHSGLGREGGRIGIEEFLETKFVNIGI